MKESVILGRWGEKYVAAYLQQQGYEILETNWKCRFGELDLIVQNQEYLCFVEVKLRKNDAFGRGAEAVDGRKQHKLRRTAELYLSRHATYRQPRFDVIELYAPQGVRSVAPEISHIENAF